MDYFEYRNGGLYCEDVPVADIARRFKTPLYVYSYKTLERHFRVFQKAFGGIRHIICYSCKANSNGAILRVFEQLGGGADIVSGGELFRALKAGIPAGKIVFSGVGKTEEEILFAVRSGIAMINVESSDELDMVIGVGRKTKQKVPVSIRVNPEIDAKTHPYITTGLKKNKFGILWEEARRLYGVIRENEYLEPVGISSHIGSQILELGPFVDAVRSLKGMIAQLRATGIGLRYLDIGGGLGITYKSELPPAPHQYAEVILEELRGEDLTLVLEPGRVLVGNSGIFVTRLLYVKEARNKTFYIVDGAMNDLVRPSLYDAYHDIIPLKAGKEKDLTVDLVGPICESGDFLAKDREMPRLAKGELLAVKGAGAYGFSMSSNYNSRRRVAEVLVKGDECFLIRRRESYGDLTRRELIPHFLEG
jgi:diaminopimelate decarboxylase